MSRVTSSPQRGRIGYRIHIGRVLPWLVSLFLCSLTISLLLLAVSPSSTPSRWLSTLPILAQIIAFPRVLGIVLLLAAVLSGIGALISVRHRRAVLLSAVTWFLTGLLFLIFPSTLPWSSVAHDTPVTGGTTLSVVTFNTHNSLSRDDIDVLIASFDPDIMVLPETSPRTVKLIMEGTQFDGAVYEPIATGFTPEYSGRIAPTTVVAHPRIGKVASTPGPATTFGSVSLRLFESGHLQIVGVHTAPPLPGLMDSWREDLNRIITFGETSSTGSLIMAGDVNATLRHGPLAARTRLVDTAQQCGVDEGTWPSSAPSFLRTRIDHIFVTSDVHVLACSTKSVGNSDHLAYAATVRLPA